LFFNQGYVGTNPAHRNTRKQTTLFYTCE